MHKQFQNLNNAVSIAIHSISSFADAACRWSAAPDQIYQLDFSNATTVLRERYHHRAPLYARKGDYEKDFDIIETPDNAELIWQRKHWVSRIYRRAGTNVPASEWNKPPGFSLWDLYDHGIELVPVEAVTSTCVQLEIEGIGQQLATLADWKKQNNIFTHESAIEEAPWSAWGEMESACDFLHEYGGEAFGYGKTEKEAIINYCVDQDIELPFWW